jgi:fructokinase
MHKILAFGEIIWDIFPDKKCIGGAPFNFLAHSAKQGATAYLVSAVGKDEIGKDALAMLKKYRINAKYVSKTDKQTGACNVTLDSNAIPRYDLLDNVAYDYINAQNISGEFDALYFGTLALRHEHNKLQVCEILKNCKFSEVFCDVNIRAPYYDEESVRLCCKNATILKISDEELHIVEKILYNSESMDIEDFQKKLATDSPNISLIVITKGSEGASVYRVSTDSRFFFPATKTKVVSTVGAGDSYSASFLTEYLKGKSILDCMEKASKVSASVVAKRGAI